MSRFFTKKSVALFSLAIALVGLFSFGVSSVAKAQQSTGPGDIYASQPVTPASQTSAPAASQTTGTKPPPPKNITYTDTVVGGGIAGGNTTSVFTYIGGGCWSAPSISNGAKVTNGQCISNDFLTQYYKFNISSIDPNGVVYSVDEQSWDAYSNTYENKAAQAQSNANTANAGPDWLYYLENPGAALQQGAIVVVYDLLQLWLIPLVSFFLTVAGNILDIGIKFSLLGQGFSAFQSVIQSIWTIARDTCNVAFIFVLLYIAIQQIIGQAGAELKKTLTSVVIGALFINFSLFFAGLIIDGGNIVATALINQITIVAGPLPQGTGIGGAITSGITGVANVATSVATGVKTSDDPQISSRIMNGLGLITFYQTSQSTPSLLEISVSSLLASTLQLILFLVTTYVFMFMAVLIIGRFVMLIFLMATSPLGFMGGTISFLSDASKKWWDEFTNQVLVAPIFAFFMLVIIKVAQVTNLASASIANTISGTATAAHLVVYFDYVFIIYLLIQAVNITKKFGGEVGKFASQAATTLSGVALGAATGSTALLARQTIGRGANMIAESDRLKNAKAKGGAAGFLAKGLLSTGSAVSKSSLDIRNTNEAKGVLGLLKDQGADIGGKYAQGGKEGFQQWQEKQRKETTETNEENTKQLIKAASDKNKEMKAKLESVEKRARAPEKSTEHTEAEKTNETNKKTFNEAQENLKKAKESGNLTDEYTAQQKFNSAKASFDGSMKKVEEFEKEYKKKMDAEKDRIAKSIGADDYTSLVNASKEAELGLQQATESAYENVEKAAKEGIVGGYLRHGRWVGSKERSKLATDSRELLNRGGKASNDKLLKKLLGDMLKDEKPEEKEEANKGEDKK